MEIYVGPSITSNGVDAEVVQNGYMICGNLVEENKYGYTYEFCLLGENATYDSLWDVLSHFINEMEDRMSE